ncbi:hypothetical protein V2I01_23635 [Micromonospora sp. BRA006-A]|nr:hypothetical protein [Micromonospora sp. BRA006-A]
MVETYQWISQLQLDVALRVTTLSWLMLLLVGGVGALVLVYSARYFRPGPSGWPGSPPSWSPSPGRCSASSSPTTCCCSTSSGN